MLERGFAANPLSWLKPASGTVDSLAPIDASPPNLRDEMCGGKRHRPASDEDEDIVASAGGASGGGEGSATFLVSGLQPPVAKPSEMLAGAPAPSEPIPVYTGPTRTGPALIAAVAADADSQTTTRRRGKKSHLAAGKHAHEPKSEAKSEQEPAPVRHANAATKPTDKSAADPSAKPAKPKAAAKPSAKPAPKTSSRDTKPAG
jgi:D-alanyl-D-alanine carboxypeptidase